MTSSSGRYGPLDCMLNRFGLPQAARIIHPRRSPLGAAPQGLHSWGPGGDIKGTRNRDSIPYSGTTGGLVARADDQIQQRLLPSPRQGIIERIAEAIARLKRPKGYT